MELVDACSSKDTTPQQATKKKRKDQKKDPLPPRNSVVLLNMLSFPQRGEIVNINLC